MHRRSRHLLTRVVPFVAVALALVVGASGARAAAPDEGVLTPELEALSGEEATGLPAEGPGSIVREGAERVVVEAHFEAGALARLEALEAAGAKVLTASAQYQTVALSVAPEDLEALAAVPGLAAVEPSRAPIVHDATEVLGTPSAAVVSNGLCEGGSVISQGVTQLNVPAARAAFGARGAGETVGVISDSFASATTGLDGNPIATTAHGDEVSNDLPGRASTCSGQQVPVDVLAEAPAGANSSHTDEGRAMLQVVHDLAPHAKLAFATALSSELEFARNIERLAEPVSAGGAGADVIVDDISYIGEPFFQDGPVAAAVDKVTAAGVTYLTSAGNENVVDAAGHDIGSWESSKFRSMTCPKVLLENVSPLRKPLNCLNFSPTGTDAEMAMTVPPGQTVTIDLQWAEPWDGVGTELSAFLFSPKSGSEAAKLLASSEIESLKVQEPIQVVQWKNSATTTKEVLFLVGRLASLGSPRVKFEFVGHGTPVSEIEYPTSNESAGITVGPTVAGHAGSPAAITVGAVRYTESASAPAAPEAYSSRGPVYHLFGPVTGTTPAAELPAGEREIAKPDITATDCASTTFFTRLEGGSYHFCGTSEAAPHAAAVAALMHQTEPLASPARVLAALRSSATAFTPATSANGPDAVGAGMVNAAGAITAIGGSPVNDPPSVVVPSLEEETAAPPPNVTITRGPRALSREVRPTFEFVASTAASFTCQVDAAAPVPCASPYVVPIALADGAHTFTVLGTDARGHSGSSGAYAFTVDTTAPRTTFAKRPKKLVKTRKKTYLAHFELRASQTPATFVCRFDKGRQRACGKSFKYRFGKGAHTVRVKARDEVGNLATGWTTYKFTVKLLRPSSAPPRHHRRR
jgi:hypothetical protein